MSLSFLEVWERLVREQEINQDPPPPPPMMGGGQDSSAMQVVRAGINLRPEEETSFWDEFMSICSNAEGVAELLGVRASEVQTWSSKIKDLIQQVEERDSQNPEGDSNSKVMSTGDEEPGVDHPEQGSMSVQKMLQHSNGMQ